MKSEIENRSTSKKKSIDVKIEELKPKMKHVDLVFKVVEKSETREVTSRRTFETQRIVDATIGDETGTVKLPLWNDTIESIDVGKTYRLENGYTGLFRGNLQLKIGRNSKLKEVENDIGNVNLNVDMSSKNHRRSQPRHHYQPYERSGDRAEAIYSVRGRDRDSRNNRYSRRRRRW
jgi:ssDNA-binding replication factor A large subunit